MTMYFKLNLQRKFKEIILWTLYFSILLFPIGLVLYKYVVEQREVCPNVNDMIWNRYNGKCIYQVTAGVWLSEEDYNKRSVIHPLYNRESKNIKK